MALETSEPNPVSPAGSAKHPPNSSRTEILMPRTDFDRDLRSSAEVVQDDDIIVRKHFDLEERCIDLIATQRPLAGDLRILITTLHISVELERIGDYAEGIAKISFLMGDEPPLKPLVDIPRMAEKATDMLRRSLDSFVNRDVVAAAAVCNMMTRLTLCMIKSAASCSLT